MNFYFSIVIYLLSFSIYSYDLWNKFKLDKSYRESDYWSDLIANEKLNESVDQLKACLRETISCYQETLAIAKCLKEQKIVEAIAIVSNHSEEWFNAIFEKCKFGEVFDCRDLIIVSQEVGAAKPDDSILEIFMQRLHKYIPDIKPSDVQKFISLFNSLCTLC